MVTRRSSGGEVVCSVFDLAAMPVAADGPIRWFSWRRAQRHRPGLQFLVSTGRHHGFESLEEARLLLALDFAGDLVDTPHLLALQRELLDEMRPNATRPVRMAGVPVSTWQYFTDMGIIAALTLLSWPQASHLSASRSLVEALNAESHHRTVLGGSPRQVWRRYARTHPWTPPPSRAHACAAALDIAHKITASPAPELARQHLDPMIARTASVDPTVTEALRTAAKRSLPLREVLRRL
jgi:hypothetical protein